MAARWLLAGVLAMALHGAPIGAWSWWATDALPPGFEDPPIAVELASLPSAPSMPEPEQDVTPGPQSAAQEETAPPPEDAVPEEAPPLAIAPTPQEPEPEIVIPEKSQEAQPEKPPQPVVKKAERPVPKPKVTKETKRAPEQRRASRESAPTRASKNAEAMASAASGAASAAAAATYYDSVKAALQRAKQSLSIPGSARAVFSVTITRSGQVAGSRIISSSGVPALDAEALAMVRRASFPPFPAAMKESSKTYQFVRNTR